MRVTFTVNGRPYQADDVWEGESLLYVLRERLGLPGSKNACEQGECGSCTVRLDGVPVCACLVAAGQAEGREVGVQIGAGEEVESLAYDLPRIPVVTVVFPKFSDGRAFTTATLLRERYAYKGEVRAVGDVLREQAGFMVRCGFDAFEPADGSTPEQWGQATRRFRHVYQRAADHRTPAFEERRALDKAAAAEVKSHAV